MFKSVLCVVFNTNLARFAEVYFAFVRDFSRLSAIFDSLCSGIAFVYFLLSNYFYCFLYFTLCYVFATFVNSAGSSILLVERSVGSNLVLDILFQ